MANKFLTTDNGGHPIVLDDFRWFLGQDAASQAIYQLLNNLLIDIKDDVILQGCVEGGSPGAVTLTEGWILLGGEILKVDAQSAFDETTDNKFVLSTSFDATGDKTFLNGSSVQTYQKRRANITGTSGNLAYNGLRIHELTVSALRDDSPGEVANINLRTKVIEIGDWDMDADGAVTFNHGIGDHLKIRSITAMINIDTSVTMFALDSYNGTTTQGGVGAISSTQITLNRLTGGDFDNTAYDSTSFNRGWVHVTYEA